MSCENSRMAAALQPELGVPFSWGTNDCSATAARIFERYSGVPLCWPQEYRTALSAGMYLRQQGGPRAALHRVATQAGLVPCRVPVTGTLGLLRLPTAAYGWAFGVHWAGRWAVRSQGRGLIMVKAVYKEGWTCQQQSHSSPAH